jgi:hypothetical protein
VRSKRWMWAVPVALIFLFVLWNPVGYVGGGADDDRYIHAAQCWIAEGPCLPTNHWEGRWPVVGALAISTYAFGLSRFSLALPFLIASAFSLYLIMQLGNRYFREPVGIAAATTFGLLPVFAIQAMSATVEPFELTFILLAVLARKPLTAGFGLGLAFQVRETSIAAFLPLAYLWRRSLPALMVGFAVPLLIEFAVFFIETGNPLYRRLLSARHVLLPSSELTTVISGPPFFNSQLLQHWKYEPGVRVHWLVDGFLNLLVNLKTGLLFVLTPLLTWFYRHKLNLNERRIASFIILASFLYSAILIYALAIDPKPRMFYVPLAGLSLALGLIAVRAWSPVICLVAMTMVPLMWLTLNAQPRHLHWQKQAEAMVRKYAGHVETTQVGYFRFSKLSSLPPAGSGRPYLLLVKSKPCRVSSDQDPVMFQSLEVVEERRSAWLPRALHYPWSVCLFRYRRGP